MKLLVVTPTLGASRWMEACGDSVRSVAAEHEHVLAAPAERTGELQRRWPDAKVVPEPAPSRGMYGAINAALAAADGWDAFTWINDDDLLRPPGFARLVERLARDPGTDVAYGRVELIDARDRRIGELPVGRVPRDLVTLFARGRNPLAQPGMIVRRSWWERLGGLDESYRIAGDMDFFVRALVAGARFAFVNATVAAFRLSAGQLSKNWELSAAETARALAPVARAPRRTGAVWRFRLGNLAVYGERVRRHGWISMRELYERTG